MTDQFKEVEDAFQRIRRQFRNKEISRREFIDQLKKLRIRDKEGRFWMIGAQTGKWYYYDGRQWVQAELPSPPRKKVKCYTCGLENDPDARTCERCGESLEEKEPVCPRCGRKLETAFQKCPTCSVEELTLDYSEEDILRIKETENFVFRRVNPLSLFFLVGGLGVVLGLIFGAFVGASDFFSALARPMPEFIETLQGTLMGGIFYAVLGGIFGFFFLGLLGYLAAHLTNGILSIIGGLRVSLDKAKTEEGSEEPRP